jgi:hypothetical protein
VAGFTFATIGVLYAVLLAFVVIIVWERFREAERALAAESGHAATIPRCTISPLPLVKVSTRRHQP